MVHTSDEEEQSDLSESEITDCVEKIYSQLKSKIYKVKKSRCYKCPFCPSKKKQMYQYNDLLQHASGIGMSSKHKPRTKAQHQALAKHLRHDSMDPKLVRQVTIDQAPLQSKSEEKYVWPWKGILVNLPLRYQDGKYMSMTLDDILRRISDFKPSAVSPLCDHKGYTGECIVEFEGDWDGFHNAMSFDKYFQSRGVGRLGWLEQELESREVHGWIAMDTDFNKFGLLGDHLRQVGYLKTIDDITREESSKAGSHVDDLRVQLDAKNQAIYEMEYKYNMSTVSLVHAMEDKERITQACYEG